MEYTAGDLQSDLAFSNGKVTGELAFIEGGLAESGPLSGDGNFMFIKFSADDWSGYTSVKVGLNPSEGSGLVEILTDPDKNGVFKVTNTESQRFEIVVSDGTNSHSMSYSLTDLVLANDEA